MDTETTNLEERISPFSQKKQSLILIVDDNPANLQFLGNLLRKNHYTVAIAQSGEETLKFVQKRVPDLILLDVMMPQMDGFETCRRLKQRNELGAIPIIFLTARSEEEAIVEGFDIGGADFITKPFHPSELLARVNVHLELKRNHDMVVHYNRRLQELLRELNQKNALLQKLVMIDSLTELLDHRHIIDRLEVEISEARRYKRDLSIIMFDIDHFKSINDQYGHQVGDKVLVEFSRLLNQNLRESDIAGRYGGEEFLIILPNTSLEGGFATAEKIRSKTVDFSMEEYDLHITISGGVCQYAEETVNELIKRADDFLYQAKKQGRNRIQKG